ncbi:MAG: asparagine synthase B [Candidatus Eisenbacteria bacterium]
MCGIVGILDPSGQASTFRERALEMARAIRHRGPDWSGVWAGDHAVLAHERLAIVGVESGEQPLVSPDGTVLLAVNGEIYNHRELRAAHAPDVPCRTGSDCEVLLPLYERFGKGLAAHLNGIFAFVLHDTKTGRSLIARDPIGVIPLYIGRDRDGHLHVASEMKSLIPHCVSIQDFPPGHVLEVGGEDAPRGEGASAGPTPERYYHRPWQDAEWIAESEVTAHDLRDGLEAAVRRQLMSDVPHGLLLSGGLDSSVVAACAMRHARGRIEEDERREAWWPRIHSFAIGLEGSPDLAAARVAADALGTVHHGFTYTIEQGLDAIRDVIRHLETFDVTTIRAATPMFLMARRIKAMGVKMVLSGEGSDEIFGGYLYFHKAPDEPAFHQETVRKLAQLFQFDCLRANKSMAAWGVEARVPFLDLEFLDLAMSVATSDKMIRSGRMEKHVLREGFQDWLPGRIVWRQKEQFSDGVGYGWIDTLRSVAEDRVTDQDLAHAAERFPVNPPWTKEGFVYRSIFDELFDHPDAARCVPEGKSIACSSPVALEWDRRFKENADPSGRAVLGVHEESRGRTEDPEGGGPAH